MKSRQPAHTPIKSQISKRSINIDGRPTGVSLEDDFWNALKQISAAQDITLHDLVLKIDNERTHSNLSSAIRVHILNYYRERVAQKA
jgi:predicted DNA-binding ribbon-helix-helix protein